MTQDAPGRGSSMPVATRASGPTKERSDEVRWIRPVEALQRDIIEVLTRPVVVGHFHVELEAAGELIRAQAESSGQKLTLTHLFIKAAAISATATPALHRMFGPLRVVEPGHADVGVSVEGEEILSPIAVIREADRKRLVDIAQELRQLAQEVRAKERRDIIAVNRFLKFFPFPMLRRLILRAVWSSPRVRRNAVGTIQFSNIGHFGIDRAEVPVVGELLLVGGVLQRRPSVGSEGLVRVTPGAEFAIHASHRKLNGQTAGSFIGRFRELLATPESLL